MFGNEEHIDRDGLLKKAFLRPAGFSHLLSLSAKIVQRKKPRPSACHRKRRSLKVALITDNEHWASVAERHGWAPASSGMERIRVSIRKPDSEFAAAENICGP